LFQAGTLLPDAQLTGRFERSEKAVDVDSVVREIEDVRREEAARLLRLQAVE
jgi:RIO kinase 1